MTKEKWFLWQDDQHSPARNMAIDEALMESAIDLPGPLLRLYEWSTNSISFGYTQKFERIPQEGYDLVRRPTGGGIVYHQHHFTYTVVLPPKHWIVKETKPVESYAYLNRCVQSALQSLSLTSSLAQEEIPKSVDRAGMVCFVTPTRYDLLSDEKKIAGSAQRRSKLGMLHQGSIECEGHDFLNAAALREVMPLGFEKIIPCEFEDYSPLEMIKQRVDELEKDKYLSSKWNQKR
ncbi:biotin/lipoate A/B protein ligase family protein [Lentisphaera profundi]|uniref:Biotin/lipoate A/B protein ligase family protein n=1 Tax=Lentisphaera profundi TaxID=1658616 RepID=A0ABY7W0J7_9BACT|nr:biotin/lipoate A/B protein ligase family protein [Lentisphaera profundi]WDE99059.1 biotin/lipoate A/B protein ligase family protein [Lentisphaera profundi]